MTVFTQKYDILRKPPCTPCEMILNTLGKERYFDIHEIIAETGEGDLSGYAEFWAKMKVEQAELKAELAEKKNADNKD